MSVENTELSGYSYDADELYKMLELQLGVT